MQINTGEVTLLELELGDTIEIHFHPKTGEAQAIFGVLIGTRELSNGEMGLTVTVPSEKTSKSSLLLPLDGYTAYLITG